MADPKDKKHVTIAELMQMGNSVTIEPDGSIKQKDVPELTAEQAEAADALPVRRHPSYY